MKATLKKLNREIAKRWPDLDIEIVKGNGYFYFNGDDGFDNVQSIYVNALNQMDFEKWMETIEWAINDAFPPPVAHELDDAKIGDGATFTIYSDRHAGTIVKRTATTIWWQADEATLLNGVNSGEPDALKAYPGGFAAHVEGVQRYEYKRNPDAPIQKFTRREVRDHANVLKRIVWKQSGHGTRSPGCVLTAGRHEHYDYNF